MKSNNIELFERYYQGDLNSEELKKFEDELEKNISFQTEFKAFSDINNVLADKQLTDFRVKLKNIHHDNFGKVRTKKLFLRRFFATAASLIILLGTAYYFLIFKTQQVEDTRLFSTFYPDMISLKGSQETNIQFSEAVSAYNAKSFNKAVSLFENIVKTDSTNSLYTFNLAMAHLGAGNYFKSEDLFEKIVAQNNSLVLDNAQWFLAICYYKTGRITKAKLQFRKIAANPTHFKANDAKKALELIEE
jgi:tetratricopeptide (TPR) repeat protein